MNAQILRNADFAFRLPQGLSRSAAGTPDPVEVTSTPSTSTPVASAPPAAQTSEQAPSEEAVQVGEGAQDLASGVEAASDDLNEAAEELGKAVEQVIHLFIYCNYRLCSYSPRVKFLRPARGLASRNQDQSALR